MADVTFGTAVFQANGIIELPLTFVDNVRYLSPTSFLLASTPAPRDPKSDFSVIGTGRAVRGANRNYTLELQIPPDRRGVLSVSGAGNIVVASSGNMQSISGMTSVNFDTTVPTIKDWHLPQYKVGERYDAKFEFNTKVTGLSLNGVSDVFQFENAAATAGIFTPYKWVGAAAPDFSTVEPEMLPTDWKKLDAAPQTDDGQFDESGNGIWHGNEAQYYLLRWNSVDPGATGIFSMTLKENTVRGPVTF